MKIDDQALEGLQELARTRPCAYCGRPVVAKNRTGRPPRYCRAEERDCQERARAERLTARAAELTGGVPALRQLTMDLGRQLDDAWEPVQELAEILTASREVLTDIHSELISRADQAEQTANTALADRDAAQQQAQAALAAQEDAIQQAVASKKAMQAAARAQAEAEEERQVALHAQQRLEVERDIALQQAKDVASAAKETIAAIQQEADKKIHVALAEAGKAKEAIASLSGELRLMRQHLAEYQARSQAAEAQLERTYQHTTEHITRVNVETDRKIEQAQIEIATVRAEQEQRVIELSQQLGIHAERADQLQRACDQYQKRLAQIAETLAQWKSFRDSAREASSDQQDVMTLVRALTVLTAHSQQQ